MDPKQILLSGVLAPAFAAGLVFAIAWRPWRRDDAPERGRSAGALAIGGGFAIGFLLMLGTPASFLPSSERTPTGLDWAFWFSLPSLILMPLLSGPGPARGLLRFVFGAALIRYLLRSQFDSNWETGEGWLWWAGLSALFLIHWSVLERLAERRNGPSGPLLLWLFATGIAVLTGLTGSAKLGQLGGTVAAGLGAAGVISWRCPRLSLAGGGAAMVAVLLFALGLNAYFYSYTPGLDISLLAGAPLLALIGEWAAKEDWSARRRTSLVFGLAALPIAVAIGRAVYELLQEVDPYDY